MTNAGLPFENPFRPGAGHTPPYLAGRQSETREFESALTTFPVMRNIILTGLRGTGKTVLLETWRPIALKNGWLWTGADLTESASVREDSVAIRILADLAPLVAHLEAPAIRLESVGYGANPQPRRLTYEELNKIYNSTPGLATDKLKTVLEFVWSVLKGTGIKGIVLAYDESQNLSDHSKDGQYPLSLLLDVFSSLQRKSLPFLLVLTGLPTLFPTLVDARAYAERMFHVVELKRLSAPASEEAILRPIEKDQCPVKFTMEAVSKIIEMSDGYPYFIQFICREAYDIYLQQKSAGIDKPLVRLDQIVVKLDADFYSGRWNNLPDRQRDMLICIAKLPNADEEFTVAQLRAQIDGQKAIKPFSASNVNQTLTALIKSDMVFKNRHGKYSLAVPMLADFINRMRIPESEEGPF